MGIAGISEAIWISDRLAFPITRFISSFFHILGLRNQVYPWDYHFSLFLISSQKHHSHVMNEKGYYQAMGKVDTPSWRWGSANKNHVFSDKQETGKSSFGQAFLPRNFTTCTISRILFSGFLLNGL